MDKEQLKKIMWDSKRAYSALKTVEIENRYIESMYRKFNVNTKCIDTLLKNIDEEGEWLTSRAVFYAKRKIETCNEVLENFKRDYKF